MNALVEDYVGLAYRGRLAQRASFTCEIVQDYDETAGNIEMVPQKIGRVVLNLLSNAFDAVELRAEQVDGAYKPLVRVSTQRVGGYVEVRISDNGPGVPSELRSKIFEPFFTTKPTGAGTGLGLSIAYDIVTQGHGGTLTVESAAGEGAEFVIKLPAD